MAIFFGNESSMMVAAHQAGMARIEHVDAQGQVTLLKDAVDLADGDVIDATHMNRDELRAYATKAMQQAKDDQVLLSLHLKATMMKVSDPVIFGEVLTVFFCRCVLVNMPTLFAELDV